MKAGSAVSDAAYIAETSGLSGNPEKAILTLSSKRRFRALQRRGRSEARSAGAAAALSFARLSPGRAGDREDSSLP